MCIFSSWGVANITTVTFNYILIIVFLVPLNVGVSPCFHCAVLVSVYRVYTSCFYNTVFGSCYSLNMWFYYILKCVISQELMRSIRVFFHKHSQITGLWGKGEGISLIPHYHFHLLHRHLDISWAILQRAHFCT